MATPVAVKSFKSWLTAEIKALDVDYEPDEQQFYEAAATIREARRIAISLDRPDIAEVCRKVRTNALAFTTAQSILSECRSLLKADRPTDVLTPPQVANRYRVSADTVREWIATGLLPATNFGKKTRPRFRISAEALKEFDKKLPANVVPRATNSRRKRAPSPDLIVTRFSSGRTTKPGRGS